MEIGEKFYKIETKNNVLKKYKIYKTDENGVDWFRYSLPSYSRFIREYTFVGKIEEIVSGEVDKLDLNGIRYYCRSSDDNHLDYHNEDFMEFDSFFTYDGAMAAMIEMNLLDEEIERKESELHEN